MKVHNEIRALDLAWQRGETRFWVNDDGPKVEIAILYDENPSELNVRDSTFVGLVDEQEGGMIAYGKPEIMDKIAHDLNKLNALEKIATAKDS